MPKNLPIHSNQRVLNPDSQTVIAATTKFRNLENPFDFDFDNRRFESRRTYDTTAMLELTNVATKNMNSAASKVHSVKKGVP